MSREDLIRAFLEPMARRRLSKKEVEETDLTLRRVADFVRENKDIQKLLTRRKIHNTN